ncbi:MAG: ATP-binding domain-containing protein, partial [Planctomycetales bacterium]|nr:ATP-binding domain-containing protein [Planctomycetales bacterium]
QYGGFLKTASARSKQTTSAPAILNEHSRAIWYVLDEEDPELAAVRAERGPGNKSWLRTVTPRVLEKLFADDSLRKSKGVFVSPFTAQTQHISQWFAQQQLDDWDVTTVHSQQGSEADVVIFDTVNASSSTWPYEEWRRLINVALSRAREAVIVLASRGEMREPYLRPLLPLLKPSSLVMVGDHLHWQTIATTRPTTSSSRRTFAEKSRSGKAKPQSAVDADQLGAQIAGRQQLKPILSSEQQRLVNLKLDGKPRLVRGVAGSGKSVVLCNWLAKTVRRLAPGEEARIWAVFANRSLHHLLRDSIDAAWQQLHVESLALFEPPPFPWEKVTLLHVKDVLAGLLPSVSLSMDEFKYDYDRAAEEFLQRQDVAELLPRCTALFIDEAQDMGPSTLKLLLALVDQTDHEDANSRSAHIFYDNDQNVYGRKTPKWSEMGLDLRGRSSVMRESFRSTVPILELALNVLKRLTPDDAQDDRRELIQQGLIKQVLRDGEPWLQVAFSHLGGPRPTFHACLNRDDEMNLLGSDLVGLIRDEHVLPRDICLIYTGQSVLKQLQSKLEPGLRAIGVELSVQTNRPFEWRDNTLMATTPHSFKGYEAEIIIVPNVDTFVVGEQRILAHALYVAMTRARSMLKLYGTEGGSPTTVYLLNTIRRCIRLSNVVPTVED